jgi:hypothetical protein
MPTRLFEDSRKKKILLIIVAIVIVISAITFVIVSLAIYYSIPFNGGG